MNVRTVILGFLALLCFNVSAQSPGSGIDVQHYTFNIDLNDSTNNIVCKTDVSLKFLTTVKSFSLDLVKKNSAGRGMLVNSVTQDGKLVPFSQEAEKLIINSTGSVGSDHVYSIGYYGTPKDGLIISKNKYGQRTFFGDNWPNRAHNWLVCVDDPADKASVDFVVTAPAHYDVVSNGLKIAEALLPSNKRETHWRETAQLSTKIMVIGVARFAVKNNGNVYGVPVYSYVFPQDSAKGFKSYAYAKEILPFFMDRIGPYAYKKLANVQSKTIFGGMENAGAIFYFEDSPGDIGIESLMAHEIAHQWFGDAASEKNFNNLWLSEGFATYLTNYYLENKYRGDTLKSRLASDREKVIAFEKDRLTPVVDTSEKSNLKVLLNPNSYEKGSWVLHMLRRKLGDGTFFKGLREYYAKYNSGNADTEDFRKIMEQASGKNLSVFFNQWLYTAGHPSLLIKCNYDAIGKKLSLSIKQQQEKLYDLPLDILIDGQIYQAHLTQKELYISIPSTKRPITITADPNVNLLATFAILGM